MAGILLSIILILFAFLAALAILKEKDEAILLRATSLIFALAVVFMFDMNWLAGVAVKNWAWVMFFAGLFLIAFYLRGGRILSEIKNYLRKYRRANGLAILFMLFTFLMACSYFHWDLAVPRYSTPDSATHFLYMHDTAQTGRMSLFGKNLITEASGDPSIAPKHNETYFPGATAAFTLINTVIQPKNPTVTLQVFNAFFYAVLTAYFIFLIYVKKIVKKKISVLALAAILMFGTFFNFVATSHSTQLLGLLFLVAFADTYDLYLRKKESFFIPAIFMGAAVTTYFYWLPPLLAFVGIGFLFLRRKDKKYFWKDLFQAGLPILAGFIFCLGYVIVMFKLDMFQYASSDGGVAFQDAMLADSFLILPFAVIELILLFLRRKNNDAGENFAAAFFGAVALFSLTLAVFYKNGFLVSHYTAMKSLYLAVPSAWVLGAVFLERNTEKMRRIANAAFQNKWIDILVFKKVIILLVVLYAGVWFLAQRYDVKYRFFPLFEDNLRYVLANDTPPALSEDQMKLLDEIKTKYSGLLQNGKIFIIGPKKNLRWVFSYSGIWPRSDSLVPAGTHHTGMASELNFAFSSDEDYVNWLKQDKNHVLVYFNKDTLGCADCNLFNFDDYDNLKADGDNFLLKLKSDAQPVYNYIWDGPNAKPAIVNLPEKISFFSRDDMLAGMLLRLQVKPKKDVQSDVAVTLYGGDCKHGGQEEAYAQISQNDLVSGKKTLQIYFDHKIKNTKNKDWCLWMEAPDKKTSDAVGIGRFADGSFDVQPIYAWPNNSD